MIAEYYKNKSCKLFQCDNLELLKQLPENYIDLIYCDILYNTGRKFKDYDDNLGSPQEAVQWYEPRLIEMKRVLKETGSIYLHMDFRLVHYLKVKMDEIFGLKNFRNNLVWCYRSAGFSKSSFSAKHDDILYYTKSQSYTFNLDEVREKEISEETQKRFGKEIEQRGGFYYGYHNGKTYKKNPYSPPRDWFIIHSLPQASAERLDYDTQKPKELLEKIIKASSNPNDIVADFFMGSGTTGDVAIELGRRFLGCDVGNRACQITKERIDKITTASVIL
jgi:DNA modification methylase